MNNVRAFLEETFKKGVSIENVFDSVGGGLNGIIFFLQAFEVWLGKKFRIKNIESAISLIEEYTRCYPHGSFDSYTVFDFHRWLASKKLNEN